MHAAVSPTFLKRCTTLRGAGRVVDLVAVEIQDRQHRTIADRIEEFVDVPRGAQGYGLGLAVAHHRGDDQSKTSDNWQTARSSII